MKKKFGEEKKLAAEIMGTQVTPIKVLYIYTELKPYAVTVALRLQRKLPVS